MFQRLYCIYDFKAEAPVNKFFQAFSTDGEATRMFAAVVQGPGTLVSEHPADFGLLFVGTVNFDTLDIEINKASRFNPVAMGDAIVREIERARAARQQDGNGSGPVLVPDPTDPSQLSIPGSR